MVWVIWNLTNIDNRKVYLFNDVFNTFLLMDLLVSDFVLIFF